MKLVSDLMIRDVLTHKATDTMQDAEQTLAQHQIRHLPIVNDEGQVVGLLSQKEFLAEAFRITDKFGAHNLRTYLAKTPIEQCMKSDIEALSPDTSLIDAGNILRNKRHGCLLITDGNKKLVGIISSQDFLRLAINLLDQQ